MLQEKPHCHLCGYTKEDAQLHMDHKLCRARGGGIPGYDDTEPSNLGRCDRCDSNLVHNQEGCGVRCPKCD